MLPQVKDAFSRYQSADSAVLRKELEELEATPRRVKVDPDSNEEVQKLREQLKGAIDIGALENEVYDHLYSFFRRYYSEGDFLAKRVHKPGVYAIPYEGEEVTLHWANKDQYYIKTSEYLRDYAFRLRPDAAERQDPMRVHFRLVDATGGEHGNVKAADHPYQPAGTFELIAPAVEGPDDTQLGSDVRMVGNGVAGVAFQAFAQLR